jgi:beta-lactamase class A
VLATPAVRRYLDGQAGDITAAVFDVRTGTLSQWRPGVTEYDASIAKVDILEALLRRTQQTGGTLDAEDQDEAQAMIEQSDDSAASYLWNQIGTGSGISAINRLIGLTHTTPGAGPYWGGTMTTAADQIALLKGLTEPNAVLTPSSQAYELGLMEHVDADQAWGVSAGVPAGVTLALKNGWLPLVGDGDWQVNSIGWVDGGGRDYLIAVLTKNNDTEGDGIATIEGLSTLVWDGLGS